MFTSLTALVSWIGGCAGLNGTRATIHRDAVDEVASRKVVLASFDEEEAEEDDARPLLSATPRTFPRQGWWCSRFDEWLSPERTRKGYTIILPGIEGTSYYNIRAARGLADAGYDGAIEIHDWTTGQWPFFVYHLMALERNKVQAQEIADKIVLYQKRYPGRPVTLIGHSGGAAMSVLVLEALPRDRKITQAVLLAGALSPDYDLSTALERTERGITNFHSKGDMFYLGAATLALGTLDRQHTVSAGAVGFRIPPDLPPERRDWYESMLHQEPYRGEMFWTLNLGGHMGPTSRRFVAKWIAPRVMAAAHD